MAPDQSNNPPRALARTVYLSTDFHEPWGYTEVVAKGTIPTPEQAARITNPAAWEPEPTPPAVA